MGIQEIIMRETQQKMFNGVKTAKITAIIIGLVLAGAASYFIFRKPSLPSPPSVPDVKSLNFDISGASPADLFPNQSPPSSDASGQANSQISDGTAVYSNPQLGFSFQYPEGFKAVSVPAGDGNESIVVEPSGATNNQQPTPNQSSPSSDASGQATNNERKGFQIYIAPFDTEGPLTAQFIRSELPAMPMQNVRTAKLASVPAVVFESQNDDVGPTFEVWFVYPESPVPHGNYLYQIMAYREFAGELTKILQTWKFQ